MAVWEWRRVYVFYLQLCVCTNAKSKQGNVFSLHGFKLSKYALHTRRHVTTKKWPNSDASNWNSTADRENTLNSRGSRSSYLAWKHGINNAFLSGTLGKYFVSCRWYKRPLPTPLITGRQSSESETPPGNDPENLSDASWRLRKQSGAKLGT